MLDNLRIFKEYCKESVLSRASKTNPNLNSCNAEGWEGICRVLERVMIGYQAGRNAD